MQLITQASLSACLAASVLLYTRAWSAPPLLVAAEVVGANLEVYVQPGTALVVQSATDGTRAALRPLQGDTTSTPPADLASWTRLRHAPCGTPATFRWQREAVPTLVRSAGTWEQPMVEVVIGETVVASTSLSRPARICGLHAQDLDPLPGEEVVVLWQTAPKPDAVGANTMGVTLLRIPETAQ